MTAKELIERLKTLPPETPVLVEGYETGFDEIVDLKTQKVVRLDQAAEWEGEYGRLTEAPCAEYGYQGGQGLLSKVEPDVLATHEDSWDSAIHADSDTSDHIDVVSAVVIMGRRGHLR